MLHRNKMRLEVFAQQTGICRTIRTYQKTDITKTVESMIAVTQGPLQGLENCTTQAFAGLDKLVELSVAASRALLGEAMFQARAAVIAEDPMQALKVHYNGLLPRAEKSVAYAQHVQTLVCTSAVKWRQAVQDQTAEAQKCIHRALQILAETAPTGIQVAVPAFINAVNDLQDRFESAQFGALRAAAELQSNVTAATLEIH